MYGHVNVSFTASGSALTQGLAPYTHVSKGERRRGNGYNNGLYVDLHVDLRGGKRVLERVKGSFHEGHTLLERQVRCVFTLYTS